VRVVEPAWGMWQPVSSLTHLLGVVAVASLVPHLVRRARGDRARQVSALFCTLCTMFVFLMSGLYHMQAPGPTRQLLRRLDHAGVWVVIAGTCVPPHLLLFRSTFWRLVLPGLVLLACAGGVVIKVLFFKEVGSFLSLMLYLGVGSVALVSAVRLMRLYGTRLARPLLWCCFSVSVGTLFFVQKPPWILWPGLIASHEVFHVAVLVAAGFYLQFLRMLLDGDFERIAEPDPGRVSADAGPASALAPRVGPSSSLS
jgi:hemolysin III